MLTCTNEGNDETDDIDLDAESLMKLLANQGLDTSLVDASGFEVLDDDDNNDDMDTNVQGLTARAYEQQHLLPRPRSLEMHTAAYDEEDTTQTLEDRGVVRLNGVLGSELASKLRDSILSEVLSIEDKNVDDDVFSAVLSPVAIDEESQKEKNQSTRFDYRLDIRSPVVKECLRALAVSSVGDVIDKVAGPDAELWELAALVSRPGSAPQIIHSDTEYSSDPCLYTAFVALQDISEDLGPTLFLPYTHSAVEHAKYAEGRNQEKYLPRTNPEIATLSEISNTFPNELSPAA